MDIQNDKYFDRISEALTNIHNDFVGFRSIDEYDEACSHVLGLVNDSFLLFSNCSYSTSVFLTISAIEECAKAEVGLYRQNSENVQRREDPMFCHDKKHLIAASSAVLIGDRLKKSLSEKTVNKIFQGLWYSKYRNVREDALYFKRDVFKLTLPSSLFQRDEAKALLLTAIEIIDDRLVGYTTKSFILGKKLEALYKSIDSV